MKIRMTFAAVVCVAVVCAGSGVVDGFSDAHMARIRHWDGIDNVRDLGGLATVDGRVVRSGMVFRSQALNDNAVCSWLTAERLERKIRRKEFLVEFGRGNGGDLLRRIGTNDLHRACAEIAAELADGTNSWRRGAARGTEESRRRILRETSLRTEMDLRSVEECWGMTASPLGEAVKWINIPGTHITMLTTDAGRQFFKTAFAVFLDGANYPIDFHCIAGGDRTGALAAVLEALLGVSEDDIVTDYAMTSLSTSGVRDAAGCRKMLRATFGRYPGASLNERVEAYVLDCGFTSGDIAKFRGIMLEKGESGK